MANNSTNVWDRSVSSVTAVGVVVLVGYLAVRNEPFADKNIVVLVRIILSLAIAVLGATIPGFLNVGFGGFGFTVRAGGALALFVITFFGSPKVLSTLRDPSATVLGPDQYPSEAIIERWPTSAELALNPKVDPKEVTFSYKNATGQNLKLFIYDFTKKQARPKSAFATPIFWQAWPFPADDSFSAFSEFSAGSGWYGFAVGRFSPDSDAIRVQYLKTENVFFSREPALIVTTRDNNPDVFQASFTTRGMSE